MRPGFLRGSDGRLRSRFRSGFFLTLFGRGFLGRLERLQKFLRGRARDAAVFVERVVDDLLSHVGTRFAGTLQKNERRGVLDVAVRSEHVQEGRQIIELQIGRDVLMRTSQTLGDLTRGQTDLGQFFESLRNVDRQHVVALKVFGQLHEHALRVVDLRLHDDRRNLGESGHLGGAPTSFALDDDVVSERVSIGDVDRNLNAQFLDACGQIVQIVKLLSHLFVRDDFVDLQEAEALVGRLFRAEFLRLLSQRRERTQTRDVVEICHFVLLFL